MKTSTTEIKKVIEELEYHTNGFGRLCGTLARAVNIRVKPRKNRVIADITLVTDEGGCSERYNNCEYDLSVIKRAIKRLTS